MLLIANKRARFEYEIEKKYLSGLVLTGPEVKSLRLKQGSLRGSHVRVINQQAFLINAQINPYKFAINDDYEPKRTRKLLLKKSELEQLAEQSSVKGRTIVPLAIKSVGRTIKLEIGIGRGQKQFEKREKLKKQALRRETDKEIKAKLRGF